MGTPSASVRWNRRQLPFLRPPHASPSCREVNEDNVILRGIADEFPDEHAPLTVSPRLQGPVPTDRSVREIHKL